MRLRIDRLIAIGLLLAVAACGGQPRIAGIPSGPRGPAKGSPGHPVSDWPVKIGNPYQVAGKWYYPKDDQNYDQTGIASWYGPKFHGLATANGEAYDMDMVSAAHKTLPLPSYVEVTNLDNGRRLVLRVNDRGPFVDGRIIDLSRRSAEILGVDRPGTAHVRVRRVYPNDNVKLALREGQLPGENVRYASAPAATPQTAYAQVEPPRPVTPVARPMAPPASMPLPQATPLEDSRPVQPATTRTDAQALNQIELVNLPPSNTSGPPAAVAAPVTVREGVSFVQVAAVSDAGRAQWLAGFLKSYGTPVLQPIGTGLIRVRLGPYTSMAAAQLALAKVQNAGYQDARIVSDGPTG